jgi:sugar lactone lactonase YvrE
VKSSASRSSRPAQLFRILLTGLGALALLPLARAASDYATPYTFSLFAGTATPGSTNGAATSASFSAPTGMALTSSGTLYIADRTNNVIRVISSSGAVTTLAGLAGTSGATDGTGTAALFNGPSAVAVGSGGDLYVADTGNNTIRRVTPQGVVTTLAGNAGAGGSLDGTGTAAYFRQPAGIAIDGSGNLYVADTGNNAIRKVTQGGVVTTLVGTAGTATTADDEVGAASPVGHADGTGTSATLYQPTGITISSAGNLYVTDTANSTIREVTTAGVVTTIAGSPLVEGTADGTGSAALFNNPIGITIDSAGNLYVADTGNSLIRKVTAAGVSTTLAGTPVSFAVFYGTGQAAVFDVPTGIAVDSSGDLYVSERLGDVIAKGVPPSGTGTGTGTTTPTVAPVFTIQPVSITVSGGEVALTALATGATSYQWMLNGTSAVLGGTGPTLVLASAVAGSYTCVATNSVGSATSNAATITVEPSTNPGRLINLSCRAQVGTGGNILITGFAVGGTDATGTDTLLIRASGPALVPYNVTGTLADPELGFYSGSNEVASDDSWGGSATIAAAASAVGAFEWTSASSHDSALRWAATPPRWRAPRATPAWPWRRSTTPRPPAPTPPPRRI